MSNDLLFRVGMFGTIFSLIAFLLAFHKNRYRMICGILFLLFLSFCYFTSFWFSITRGYNSVFFGLMSLLLIVLLFLGFAFFLLTLLYSGIFMVFREGLRFQNIVALLLLVYLVAAPLILQYAADNMSNSLLVHIINIVMLVMIYLIAAAIIYVTSGILVVSTPQITPVDYVIVLGCGLINGDQITQLLKGRVDKGIALYNKDPENTVLIFSGGKGKDETVPEAYAMKQYALSKGIPEDHILMEDKSTNTKENMQFSYKLIRKQGKNKPKMAFSTNRFHQFRAGVYAYQNGMHIRGVGSTTKLYFAINASVREYIALFARDWKKHLIVISSLIALYIVTAGFRFGIM